MKDVIEGHYVIRGTRRVIGIVLIICAVLGLLLGIGLGGASWWIMRKMGPDVWVMMLEKNCNCRGQIKDAKLSLFSRPAKLIFQDVKIAPRDAEVAKPLAERIPLAEGAAPIVIPEVVLEVKLDDLLNRRLFIEQLKIHSPAVTEVQDEQGRSTLEYLFRKPGTENEVPRAIPVNAPGLNAPGLAPQPIPTAAAPSSKSSGFAFAISSASLDNGSLTITSKTTQVHVTALDFTLTGIDVEPADLEHHNHMHATLRSQVQVTGMARIGGVKRPAELANLQLSGEANMVPIDPATRLWSPTTMLKLTLAKDSMLAGHITMGDAAGKEMKKLLEYGVDLGPVRVGGPLLEPAVVDGIFRNNLFSLISDTRFVFPEYEVLIEKKSWLNSVQDRHEMNMRLACGGALQARLQQGVAQAKLGESLARGVIKALSDERGRMTFDIESTGSLSDPEIKPKLDRILKNLIRGEGLGDLLQGLLKKL